MALGLPFVTEHSALLGGGASVRISKGMELLLLVLCFYDTPTRCYSRSPGQAFRVYSLTTPGRGEHALLYDNSLCVIISR